jgi:hypothetical protein
MIVSDLYHCQKWSVDCAKGRNIPSAAERSKNRDEPFGTRTELRKASRRISQLYRSRQRAKAKYALGLQISVTIHALLRRHPGHPCEAELLDGKAEVSSRGTGGERRSPPISG